MVFSKLPYINLEAIDTRNWAINDPRNFLMQFPNGGVIDEVQRAPELFSYLQERVDNDGRLGLFLLTGSQHFGLLSGVTQSLAGRSAFIELLPLAYNELVRGKKKPSDLNSALFMGGYPALYDRPVNPTQWFAAYVSSYIERDVRQLLKVQDLAAFQRFVRLCAGRSGQLLNLSSLADDCGITHNTAKEWISVLETSYIVFLLKPHHKNFNKRLIKTPKLYFYDSGLLCWLLGVQEPWQLDSHPLRGAIFETYIVGEIKKLFFNAGQTAMLYFWRDSNGNEVDLLLETQGKLIPVEIKSGMTINSDFFIGLKRYLALAKKTAVSPTLIYGNTTNRQHQGTHIFGFNSLEKILTL